MRYDNKTFYKEPPVYRNLKGKVYHISHEFNFVKQFSIGRSVLGRKLYALGLGNMKNATLLAGAFHGQEWLTASLLLRFFEELCRYFRDDEKLFDINLREVFVKKGLLVVPMVNPDGVEIALNGAASANGMRKQILQVQQKSEETWQANARGVDLNHNFDAGFAILQKMERERGITGPSPRRYGGPCPHSEPETKAMVNLVNGLQFRQVYAYHSQGEEIYYDYGEHTPDNALLIAKALAAACGYTVSRPEGLASHGGFKDWFIQCYRRPGFTIEIGKGVNPLPIEDLEPIFARLLEMMLISVVI